MDVACLLVPEFPVALARRDAPALRGRPLIFGGSPEEHAQVRACSREAMAAGVDIGTTLRRALTLCPRAVFLVYQEAATATDGERIAALVREHSPLVEEIAPGHLHFDVRGLARLTGQPQAAYALDLQQAVASASGLEVGLAFASTIFAAHAAASTAGAGGPPVLIEPGDTRDYLAPLPVEILPVGPLIHERLRLFGLQRLGQVAALPFTAMQAQFGRQGARAWELARGRDDSRIVPQREEARVTEEMELPAPTVAVEPLLLGTRWLLDRALRRPEVRGHSLRRLDWRLGLEDGGQISRRFVFREPTADLARTLLVVKSRIEQVQLPAAAIALGVTFSGLCSEYGHQVPMWQTGPRRLRELLEALEQLATREGEPQVYRIVEVEPWSRMPERQLALAAYAP